MRTLFAVMVFMMMICSALEAEPFYVKIEVSLADEASGIQREAYGTLYNDLAQRLRKFSDVKLVTLNEGFAVNVECVRVMDLPILACSYTITRPFSFDFFRSLVLPRNDAAWDAFTASMKDSKLDIYRGIRMFGITRTETFADEVVNTLNANVLEPVRQAITDYERAAKPGK